MTEEKYHKNPITDIHYVQYDSSKETTYLPAIRQMISKDLSEPYSIYVYRYFLYQWGELCFMVSLMILMIGALVRTDTMKRLWTLRTT